MKYWTIALLIQLLIFSLGLGLITFAGLAASAMAGLFRRWRHRNSSRHLA